MKCFPVLKDSPRRGPARIYSSLRSRSVPPAVAGGCALRESRASRSLDPPSTAGGTDLYIRASAAPGLEVDTQRRLHDARRARRARRAEGGAGLVAAGVEGH